MSLQVLQYIISIPNNHNYTELVIRVQLYPSLNVPVISCSMQCTAICAYPET